MPRGEGRPAGGVEKVALLEPYSESALVWRRDVAGVEAGGLHASRGFRPLSLRAGPPPRQADGQGTKGCQGPGAWRNQQGEDAMSRRAIWSPAATREAGSSHGGFRPPDPGPPKASRRFRRGRGRFRRQRGSFRQLSFPSTLEGLESHTPKWRVETPRRGVHGKASPWFCTPGWQSAEAEADGSCAGSSLSGWAVGAPSLPLPRVHECQPVVKVDESHSAPGPRLSLGCL